MKVRKIAGLLASFTLAFPVEPLAQDLHLIEPGDRVSITASTVSRAPTEGRVLRVEGDTLTLAPSTFGGPYRVIAMSSVERLKVSRGTKHYASAGAILGLLAGGVAGHLAGKSFLEEHSWDCGSASMPDTEFRGQEHQVQLCSRPSGQKGQVEAIAFTLAGAAAGAGVGALIGSAIKTERWEEIPLDNLRIQPSPVAPDGVSVSASLRL